MAEQNRFDKFDASDFVNLALSKIPSEFGRLALLADLRDQNDDELANMLYGKEELDQALRGKHREIFLAWLGLSLTEQLEDVAGYLANEGGKNGATIATLVQRWVQEKSYERLRPTLAGESEWRLFSSDLQTILQLLLRRPGSPGESHHG